MKKTILTSMLCMLFFNPDKNYNNAKGNETLNNRHRIIIIDKYIPKNDLITNEFKIYLKSAKNINFNQISVYDSLIKFYSKEINWDWRLLASLIYQESRFNSKVTSQAGAYGLMQMMPVTQKFFGIDITVSPEEQIEAGVKYIKFLNIMFKNSINNKNERIKFILASYNIGAGHVFDARRLAIKQHRNPYRWFKNVEQSLLSKSKPENYNDTINVRNGYCCGIETYKFVQEIIERYEMFKKYYN